MKIPDVGRRNALDVEKILPFGNFSLDIIESSLQIVLISKAVK